MLNFGGVSIHPFIGISIRDPFFGVRTEVQDPTPWAQHLQCGGPWMKQGNSHRKNTGSFFCILTNQGWLGNSGKSAEHVENILIFMSFIYKCLFLQAVLYGYRSSYINISIYSSLLGDFFIYSSAGIFFVYLREDDLIPKGRSIRRLS